MPRRFRHDSSGYQSHHLNQPPNTSCQGQTINTSDTVARCCACLGTLHIHNSHSEKVVTMMV
ncbi:hypothetical protein BDP55DRAFT_680400, partial [Colletotrichum godetiae]